MLALQMLAAVKPHQESYFTAGWAKGLQHEGHTVVHAAVNESHEERVLTPRVIPNSSDGLWKHYLEDPFSAVDLPTSTAAETASLWLQ